jgi:N-methylhydantoinase A
VQRGLDPRDFGIVAFGGAGPLHANAVAAVLGCYPVIVPKNPGVLSALGFIQSEFKNEFVQTFIRSTIGLDRTALARPFGNLAASAKAWLDAEAIHAADRRLTYSIDMRYEQQGFEIAVEADDAVVWDGDPTGVIARFHQMHEGLYGVRFQVPVELIALRVTAIGATPAMLDEHRPGIDPTLLSDASVETRPCYFDGRWIDTPHYDRARLPRRSRIKGPAIILQYDTTTVLLPRHWAEADDLGNIMIWPDTKPWQSGKAGT